MTRIKSHFDEPRAEYNYHELNRVYPRLSKFFKPSKHEKINKEKFGIYYVKHIPLEKRSKYLDKLEEWLRLQNRSIEIDVCWGKKLKIFTPEDFMDETISYIEDLKEVELPFGLRKFSDKPFNKFVECIEDELIKKFQPELSRDELDETLFTNFFVWSQKEYKSWEYTIIKEYLRLKGIKWGKNHKWEKFEDVPYPEIVDKYDDNDDEVLAVAGRRVITGRIKLAYAGLMKEKYVKIVLASHPQVVSGDWMLYETNEAGDGIGIDFMMRESNGNWISVAVTSQTKENKLCDVKLLDNKQDCKELFKKSWIYIPKDIKEHIEKKIEQKFDELLFSSYARVDK